MFAELLKIIINIVKINKNFFLNNRTFGEASIYFAISIVIISSLISIIPNTAFLEFMDSRFNLGEIAGPSIRSVLIGSAILWIIKTTYLYFVGVILFPNKNTKCNFRKVFILVGYAHVLFFFNFLIINPYLLVLSLITYIWYNAALIVGINIIFNYKNLIKSSLIVLAPFIIILIIIISQNFGSHSNITLS